jgi:mRNA-degrading endonuclease toxin of MazEF toxin-antitoxin module|nr:type II toxin-antitoxin system PemK/MazF family toxin [Thiocapsa sp. UBA6158]
MRDVHPFLVLSPKVFNERTSLVISLPMTSAAYKADNPFAVAVGAAGQTSDVLCHQRKSFDWRLRSGASHPTLRRLLTLQIRSATWLGLCARDHRRTPARLGQGVMTRNRRVSDLRT